MSLLLLLVLAGAQAQLVCDTLQASVDVPLLDPRTGAVRSSTRVQTGFAVETMGSVWRAPADLNATYTALRIELFTSGACPRGFSFAVAEDDCGVSLLFNGAAVPASITTAAAACAKSDAAPPTADDGKRQCILDPNCPPGWGGLIPTESTTRGVTKDALPTTTTTTTTTTTLPPTTTPPLKCKAISSFSTTAAGSTSATPTMSGSSASTGSSSSAGGSSAATTNKATVDNTESSSVAASLSPLLSKVVAATALSGAAHWRSPALACVALGGAFAAPECAAAVRVTAIAGTEGIKTLLRCPKKNDATLHTVLKIKENNDVDDSMPISGGWEIVQRFCGRPFFGHSNDTEPVLAAARVGDGKSLAQLNERALRWTKQAQGEHASVASFAAFSLQLMVNGAPFSLLSGAASANADEVRHAEQSLALATRFAGAEIKLDAFPSTAVASLRAQSIGELAEAVLREGCVGETLSVLESARQVDGGADMDAVERTVLHGIVRDELKHSALAWRTLAWASRGAGAERLQRVVDELEHTYASPAFDQLVRPLANCLIGNERWSDAVASTDAVFDGNAPSIEAEAIRSLLKTFASVCQ
jgi:hypothetical protein